MEHSRKPRREKANQLARIMLLYSRSDAEVAVQLSEELTHRGFSVVIDSAELQTGMWQARLTEMISEADTLLYLVSDASVTSPVCHWEVEAAQREGKRIVPIDVSGNVRAELPEWMAKQYIVQLDHSEGWESCLNELVHVLNRDLEWLVTHTQLQRAARAWISKERHPDYLLRGEPLRSAQVWISRQPVSCPGPTPWQREFIDESGRRLYNLETARILGTPYNPEPLGKKIFISYRREDSSQYAGRIFDRLLADVPAEDIFFDVESIPAGRSFEEYIRAALQECAAVLVIIGRNWARPNWKRSMWRSLFNRPTQDFVETEVSIALSYRLPILPVLIEGAKMPSAAALPGSIHQITTLNAIEVGSGREFHSSFGRILEEIRSLREKGNPPAPARNSS